MTTPSAPAPGSSAAVPAPVADHVDDPVSGQGASHTPVRYARVQTTYFDLVLGVFVSVLLISGVTAAKLFDGPTLPDIRIGPVNLGGPLIFDGGAFLFPLAYVIDDVMTEVYGFRRARRAIYLGFAMELLAAITYRVVSLTHPVQGFEAWNQVLSPLTRLTVAGLAGYLFGELLNSWVVVRMKARAREHRVALRLITSTVVGEFVDTALFCTIAYAGTISMGELTNYTVTGYVYKCLVEFCVVPISLLVIRWLKKHEPTYYASDAAA